MIKIISIFRKYFKTTSDSTVKSYKPQINDVPTKTHSEIDLRLIDSFSMFGWHKSSELSKPTTIDNLPLPWFTYPFIEFLNSIDLSNLNILEFGSGNSSIYWLCKQIKLTSIENDYVWFTQVTKEMDAKGLKANLKYCQTIQEYVAEAEKSGEFDIIVVDGRYRFDVINSMCKHFKDGSMVIFDNSDWHPNSCKLLRSQGFHQIDFPGFGPINSYSWVTSLFFKQYPRFLDKKIKEIYSIAGRDAWVNNEEDATMLQ
jgi:hypothetical protein